ncbi:MAG: UDP-N-acetylmuramoyl-L-alanine--D-glutamate ligase [Armatimonadota bacterium]
MVVKSKNITVVGLSRTGIALVKYLHKSGANIFISESKPYEEILDVLKQIKDIPVKVEAGGHTDLVFKDKDLVLLSPGVDINDPVFARAARFVEVLSEIEFAYRQSASKIIGVTGTNGKSTTTKLTYELLKKAGFDTAVGGNIGNPLIGEVEAVKNGGFLVSEVSTFQLEGIKDFKPFISFILNITPDHIDRHKSMGSYIRLKSRIFENQDEGDYLILNYDDPNCRELALHAKSRVYFFSRTQKLSEGAYLDGDKIYFKEESLPAVEVIKTEDIPVKGVHNIENVLAVSCVLKILNIDKNIFKKGLKDFKPLRHRMEFVREIKGVKFYDDSKGTNPACVMAALNSFSEPVILIAGGRPKETDFLPMAELIAEKVKYLVLIGEAKDLLEEKVMRFRKIPVYKTDNFEEALRHAHKISSKGDVVLLSPACTSFDMFKNAEERGDRFQEIVNNLE